MLQSDCVFPSSSCFSWEDQSLLVGMNTFLVFTLAMVTLAFFSHHWNASCCCCWGCCNHCCTRICRCDHVKCRCLPLLEDLQIRFVAVFPSITAVILASNLRVLWLTSFSSNRFFACKRSPCIRTTSSSKASENSDFVFPLALETSAAAVFSSSSSRLRTASSRRFFTSSRRARSAFTSGDLRCLCNSSKWRRARSFLDSSFFRLSFWTWCVGSVAHHNLLKRRNVLGLSCTIVVVLLVLLHVFISFHPLWGPLFSPAVGPLFCHPSRCSGPTSITVFWISGFFALLSTILFPRSIFWLVTRIMLLFVFTQSACSPSLLAWAVLALRRRCLRVRQSRLASAVPAPSFAVWCIGSSRACVVSTSCSPIHVLTCSWSGGLPAPLAPLPSPPRAACVEGVVSRAWLLCHSRASPGTPRRWACASKVCTLRLSSGFALLGFPRSRTVALIDVWAAELTSITCVPSSHCAWRSLFLRYFTSLPSPVRSRWGLEFLSGFTGVWMRSWLRSGDIRSRSFLRCVLPWSGFLLRLPGCTPAETLCDSPQLSPLRLAVCLVVSGHVSTQTCSNWLTGLHVWWSLLLWSLVLLSCLCCPLQQARPAPRPVAAGDCTTSRGLVEGLLLLQAAHSELLCGLGVTEKSWPALGWSGSFTVLSCGRRHVLPDGLSALVFLLLVCERCHGAVVILLLRIRQVLWSLRSATTDATLCSRSAVAVAIRSFAFHTSISWALASRITSCV